VQLDSKAVLMSAVTTFRGAGTIRIEGVMRWTGGGNFDVAIVGGSGAFRGVRGTLHYWATVAEQSSNKYELRLPGSPVGR
jgi:hypothetical protein